ncbi:3-deoxy-7-phosphoheptulonate synthase [Salinibacterium soli]|uniref:Phospho-2-dehydro-3-deoxyheptonate aldolase n=1 Tax=Antiquaquibacter soli TaxID=3064523 RepID=A0ABT9BQC8_9MICO|nr:3-deoxy-7-phosphoheptulonate synthase [Protaetiibacter sp. WY-16]MDO7883236.1 3-deoxy-7-phosphoheptulonate synthase [Protaetiibacter sp. WY-16]
MTTTRNQRVTSFTTLPSPAALRDELPLSEANEELVNRSRAEVEHILSGEDDRLLVVVGPCSVHDPVAALDYARRLAPLAAELSDDLLVVMRVYFEKPRSNGGWKGLINDPGLDGSHDVVRGLRTARRLLTDVLDEGLPIACEFLEPVSPQYIADAVSWGAIGARTTESQVHRQLASGLSMPVGFKNGMDGDLQSAIDGCLVARRGQVFFGADDSGAAAVVATTGNPATHLVLRGGKSGPNYSPEHVADAAAKGERAGIPTRIVVDASHANSNKDHVRQAVVAREIAQRLADAPALAGVMLESFLEPGRQELTDESRERLVYGQSVTDACLGWDDTADLLRELAAASRSRRRVPSAASAR